MATNDDKAEFPHSVEDLDLTVRTTNALLLNDILTLEQLCCTSSAHLLTFRNFGRTSLREVVRTLDRLGLRIGCGHDAWAEKAGVSSGVPTIGKSDAATVQLRDYFAAKVMAGALSNQTTVFSGDIDECIRLTCEMSYRIADAMLAAREVKP